ncbi:MAG: flagellar biosynthesis protein FlaG [Piscirickettsiaceae bacterium]|nr:MAG: flagellar biosynthesis protein FlaG [Piscirickettsiaceae bacterium]
METTNLVNTVVKALAPKPTVSVSHSSDNQATSSPTGNVLPERVEVDRHVNSQELRETVSNLNEFVQNIQRGIQFSVHEETGRTVITVTDKETGEEIRTFPSEEVLAIAKFIAETKAQHSDMSKGIVFNQSA